MTWGRTTSYTKYKNKFSDIKVFLKNIWHLRQIKPSTFNFSFKKLNKIFFFKGEGYKPVHWTYTKFQCKVEIYWGQNSLSLENYINGLLIF